MVRPTLVLLSRRGRDSVDAGCLAELRRRAQVRVVALDGPPGRREAIDLLAAADLLGSTKACLPVLDAALLDALPRLRGIVLYATGYDQLDVDLLRSRGVGLSVLPGYATTAVAEHALAMLLSLATRLHLANDRSRGLCPPSVSLRGIEMADRHLGVVGVGRIGRRVALLGAALGMRVAGTDIDPLATLRARDSGVRMGEPEWLLRGSDVLMVCASHVRGSPPIIRRHELGLLPPGALLVNATRAALVDTAAAVAAIRSGRLRGYAVDDVVVDPAVDGDLLAEGRVVQTAHSAWWRDEVLARGALMWSERLLAAVRDQPLDAVTWPSGDAPPRSVPMDRTTA